MIIQSEGILLTFFLAGEDTYHSFLSRYITGSYQTKASCRYVGKRYIKG